MKLALQSVGPTIQLDSGDHLCTLQSLSGIVTYPEAVQFTCDGVDDAFETTEITLNLDAPTRGWRYRILVDDTEKVAWTTYGTSVLYLEGFMPAHTIDFGPTVDGTSEIGQLNVTATTSDETSARSETLVAYRSADPLQLCNPTISASVKPVDFGSSVWNGTGFTLSTTTIGLAITAAGDDCSGTSDGWSIQVSASPLTGPGSTIPAEALSYLGTARGDPPPVGLAQERGPLPLATSGSGPGTHIASGSSSVISGTIWDVTFAIDPPIDTPPGSYSGTITVDIAHGD